MGTSIQHTHTLTCRCIDNQMVSMLCYLIILFVGVQECINYSLMAMCTAVTDNNSTHNEQLSGLTFSSLCKILGPMINAKFCSVIRLPVSCNSKQIIIIIHTSTVDCIGCVGCVLHHAPITII